MTEHFSVLLVDDDTTVIEGLGRMLAEVGRLRFATNGRDALRLARTDAPDLVLLDIELPDLDGLEVCRQMKADPMLAEVPVVFVTSHHDPAEELAGLSLGAVDFIHKPASVPLVLARVRTHLRMKRMADALRRAADTDGLTGIANRRRFDDALAHEWLRAQRSGGALSLLLIDIDHFKAYNDRYGHPAGDRCLRAVAQAMARPPQRPADLLARWGGEEFALLLPDTPAAGAVAVAQQLLQAVDALQLPHAASPVAPRVTVSIGAACGGASPQALLDGADRALYQAKAAGRHRVVPWPSPGDAPPAPAAQGDG